MTCSVFATSNFYSLAVPLSIRSHIVVCSEARALFPAFCAVCFGRHGLLATLPRDGATGVDVPLGIIRR